MNREQFEQLLADALGDELTPEDRTIFERCLHENQDWRREYESARGTLGALRSLSTPPKMIARREGTRLVFEPADHHAATPALRAVGVWQRYAAAILVAFTAGYAAHATLLMKDAVRPPQGLVDAPLPNPPDARPDSLDKRRPTRDTNFRTALVDAHRRKPSRSGLANCLIAMGGRR